MRLDRSANPLKVITMTLAVAVLLAVGALILGQRHYQLEQEEILLGSRPFFATQSFVIRELRRQTEAQLQRKDTLINTYLEQIGTLQQQRALIDQEFAAARAEFERSLAIRAELLLEERVAAIDAQTAEEREAATSAVAAQVEEEMAALRDEFVQRQADQRELQLSNLDAQRETAASQLEQQYDERDRISQQLGELEQQVAAAEPGESSVSAEQSDSLAPIVDAFRSTIRRLETELAAARTAVRQSEPTSADTAREPDAGEEVITVTPEQLEAAVRAARRDALEEATALITRAQEDPAALYETDGLVDLALELDELLEQYRITENAVYRRIGRVSLVGENEITAETIGGGAPEIGSIIEVRYQSEGATRRIARYVVETVRDERFTARLETVLSTDRSPRVLDPVYLEVIE